MADRKTERRDPSGTAGGKDLEPLRGGMREVDRGAVGPQGGDVDAARPPPTPGQEHEPETSAVREPRRETAEEKDPAAPYHVTATPAGGLAPRATPGQGTGPQRPTAGELEATAGRKIAQERGELDREAAHAPRADPADRGVDE